MFKGNTGPLPQADLETEAPPDRQLEPNLMHKAMEPTADGAKAMGVNLAVNIAL